MSSELFLCHPLSHWLLLVNKSVLRWYSSSSTVVVFNQLLKLLLIFFAKNVLSGLVYIRFWDIDFNFGIWFCRQFETSRYSTLYRNAIGVHSAHFGSGEGPILMGEVGCSGNESWLSHCHYNDSIDYCYHFEDAGVICCCPNYIEGDAYLILV